MIISDLLRGDIQLASPPSVYLSLQAVIEDPAKNARDAAYVIESDAATAARLLRIVNSAFFGFPSKIGSISAAVTLIGLRELQNLTLATIVIDRFSELPGQQFSMRDVWASNLRCALIAKHLDALSGKRYAETIFLCGLIHNIGQLVMYRRIPVLAREVDLLVRAQASPDVDEAAVEEDVIGFDRFQLGAELCRLWKLPEEVVDSIRLHRACGNRDGHAGIAELVKLADFFAKAGPADTYGLLPAAGGWSKEEIALALELALQEFEAIFALFYPAK